MRIWRSKMIADMFRNRRRRRTATGGAWLALAVVLVKWPVAVTANGSDPFAEVTLRFSREPEDMILARRSQAVLDCSATANGSQDDVEISWRKEGEALVPPGTRWTVYSNGSLVIRHFAKQQGDEGAYECVASVGNKALVSRRARLQEAALGAFSGHPISVEVPLGGNARFECVIRGIPKPNITWRRNGRSLLPSDRLVHVTSGVLQLTNVTSADVGSYSCHASSFGHERTSDSAELTLGSAAKEIRILWAPEHQEVELGTTATFECLPSRGGYSVLWSRKDGAALPLRRSRTFGSGNLEIREVQADDSADYSCEIVNAPAAAAAAAAAAVAQATLTVTVPPKFVNFSKQGHETRAQTIRMTCRFSGGQPAPAISWTKNGRPVTSFRRTRVQGNTLVITQTVDRDSALYQCWAENSVGRDGGIIPLTIESSEDDPSPPTGLRAYSVESRSVELTWDPPPDNNLSLVGYSVHAWAVLGNGGEIQEVTKQPPKKIMNLQPFTNYTFFVRAYGSVGASEPSQDIYLATREDVPLEAPLVSLFPLTPTSVNISWQKLSLQQARGTVVEYRIFYRKQEEPARNFTVPGNILDHTLTGLETDEKYSVRVLAGTRAGFPRLGDDQWPWVSWVAGGSAPHGANPLSNVNVHVLSATEVNITWDHPPLFSDGVLIDYNLIGQLPKTIIKTEEETGHLLTGLQPDSVYEFKIGMIAENYDEENFYRQTIRTPPVHGDKLSAGAPVILEVSPVNETAIQLSWQMPGAEFSPASYYSVVYVPTAAEGDGEMSLNSTETSVVITGLMPMTEYKILVQSHTVDGPGQFSSAVTCHTDEGRPPALLHLTWFLQEPTVVQLNWKMPPHTSGVILKYVVSYCEDKFASDHSWKTRVENASFCYTVLHGLKGRTVYLVRMHAENRKGAGPASSVKVITGIPDDEESSSNERLMGIVIGIGISGGCIIICVIIILLRNRCFPPPPLPPPRGSSFMMQHTNGFATPLHCNGYVADHADARCDANEPDGTVPMLAHDPDTINNKPEITSPRQVDLWSSVEDGRTGLTDRSTTVV